jgi:uncharacterized protein (DUF1697 family)
MIRRGGCSLMVGMARQIVLLRGINLGSSRRVAMPELRRHLTDAGFREVRTYLGSGNVLLDDGGASTDELARRCEDLIRDRFGFDVAIITRTAQELDEIVRRDPLGSVATDPKRYQVTFAATEPAPDALHKLEALAAPSERILAIGREVYSWHPEGVARSRLWAGLAGRGLGVTATARNWTTVTTLLDLAAQE